MLQASKTRLGIPPSFKDRCVVRCTDYTFGPNSKDNPMITCNWELIGIPNTTGGVETSMKRGGIEYQLASLKLRPSYFTLVEKAINFYADFWSKVHDKDFEGVDETNPDIGYLENLCMEAIVSGQSQLERKVLTDEEKQALIAEGKPAIGEPILDGDGNKIERPILSVTMWLRKFTGEVPVPF